jgi:UDP-N-acetylglucosamine 2-epimerase (non-hydrolysing)
VEGLDTRIRFLKPFGFFDYVRLQMEAFCTLSDSGTITEEASLLNLPAVTIRNAHERPEGMDEGTLIMCGLGAERVLDAVRVVVAQQASGASARIVPDYEGGAVSFKILRIVLSYTDYVNRMVWRRPH